MRKGRMFPPARTARSAPSGRASRAPLERADTGRAKEENIMRLSDEQIRQGLLHADREVRSACLRYFVTASAGTRRLCRP